jgi:hypothetical protein
MELDAVLDLLAIDAADRADCAALFADTGDDALVAEVVASITRSIGTFNEVPVEEPTLEPLVWLKAYLLLAPAVVEWHRAHDVPETVTRDTLADVGRHVAISRRVTGEFGLQTWRWLSNHYSTRLFALGRLQFALQRTSRSVAGVLTPGDWVLEAHIPESGPLLPELVDESLAAAREFFAQRFAGRPVSVVTCNSWMLDPFLVDRVAPTSNVGGFIRRFTPFGDSSDGHTDALYFVFRTRDLSRVPTLPRETSLQRAVLERLDRGESWQIAWGYLLL